MHNKTVGVPLTNSYTIPLQLTLLDIPGMSKESESASAKTGLLKVTHHGVL